MGRGSKLAESFSCDEQKRTGPLMGDVIRKELEKQRYVQASINAVRAKPNPYNEKKEQTLFVCSFFV